MGLSPKFFLKLSQPRGPLQSLKTKSAKRGSQKNAEAFAGLCERCQIDRPTLEHRFHAVRMWRFDIAWPRHRIAIEVDGGSFIAGRHNRGGGFKKDMEKSNAAILDGWRVLRVVPQELLKFDTVAMVKRLMRIPGPLPALEPQVLRPIGTPYSPLPPQFPLITTSSSPRPVEGRPGPRRITTPAAMLPAGRNVHKHVSERKPPCPKPLPNPLPSSSFAPRTPCGSAPWRSSPRRSESSRLLGETPKASQAFWIRFG